MSYIPAALSSLQSSTALLNSLQFTHSPSLSLALLAPEASFETHLIRDAAPHELALFQPSTTRYDAPLLDAGDLSLGGGQHEERWTAAKRAPPMRVGGWEKASPLKERRGAQGQEDPKRCLSAAERLLGVYPMPRAQEHVQALKDQYEGLLDTLQELEGQLKRPLPRSHLNPHAEKHARAAELEELIKREQMEIFALEQLKGEKELEIQAAAARPPPRKPPIPNPTLKPSRSHASLTSSSRAETETETAPTNLFAKSSLLDSNAHRAAASSPRAARAARSTPTASPGRGAGAGATPQTTPRAARIGRASLGSANANAAGSPVAAAAAKSPARATASAARRSIGGSAETTPKKSAAGAGGGTRRSIGGGGAAGGKKDASASGSGRKAVEGVTKEDLEGMASKIWATPTLADALRPWGRKLLQSQHEDSGEEVVNAPEKMDIEGTIATLSSILLSPPAPDLPPSPGSIISSTLTTDSSLAFAEPSPPSSSSVLEYKLLLLLLSTLSGAGGAGLLPELSITLKEPILASSLGGSPTLAQRGKKDALVSMLALKAHLGEFAKSRGWDESGGTTAIYGLVSKGVVRIDRRGREGGLVGFRA